MNPIVRDEFHDSFIRRKHAMQIPRGVPLLTPEIQSQSNDRQELVRQVEAGEELLACLWFLCILVRFGSLRNLACLWFLCILVRFGSLRNLCGILQCIVKHRPHRHRIVNLRLVFNGQEKVGGMVVRHGNHHLRHIPESLHRNAGTVLPVRQGDQRRIQRPQRFRPNHLLPAKQLKIKGISKCRRILHICPRNRIQVPHAVLPSFIP